MTEPARSRLGTVGVSPTALGSTLAATKRSLVAADACKLSVVRTGDAHAMAKTIIDNESSGAVSESPIGVAAS